MDALAYLQEERTTRERAEHGYIWAMSLAAVVIVGLVVWIISEILLKAPIPDPARRHRGGLGIIVRTPLPDDSQSARRRGQG